MSPRFPHGFMGEFKGSSPWKFAHNFPAEIREKYKRIFYVDISPSPQRITEDISTCIFPSKSLSAIKGYKKGHSCEK